MLYLRAVVERASKDEESEGGKWTRRNHKLVSLNYIWPFWWA